MVIFIEMKTSWEGDRMFYKFFGRLSIISYESPDDLYMIFCFKNAAFG